MVTVNVGLVVKVLAQQHFKRAIIIGNITFARTPTCVSRQEVLSAAVIEKCIGVLRLSLPRVTNCHSLRKKIEQKQEINVLSRQHLLTQ